MLYKRKYHFRVLTALIAILLFASSSIHSENFDAEKWRTAGIVGSLLIGAVALGSALGFAFAETNEQATDKGYDNLYRAKKFEGDVHSFSLFHHITSPHISASRLPYDELNELAPIALRLVNEHRTMSGHLTEVYGILKALRASRDNIAHRLQKIDYDPSQVLLANRMKSLLGQIDDFLPYLSLYYEFLYAHRRYFELYELHADLYNRYQKEYQHMQRYAYDRVGLTYAIQQTVGAHPELSMSPYKFVTYHLTLVRDIHSIRECKLAYRYPHTESAAQGFTTFLEELRGIIEVDPFYLREKYEKSQEDNRTLRRTTTHDDKNYYGNIYQ